MPQAVDNVRLYSNYAKRLFTSKKITTDNVCHHKLFWLHSMRNKLIVNGPYHHE